MILSGCFVCNLLEDHIYESDSFSKIRKDIKNITFISAICDINSCKHNIKNVIGKIPYKNYYDIISKDFEIQNQLFLDKYNRSTSASTNSLVLEYKIPNEFGSYYSIFKKIYTVDREFMKSVKDN